MRRVEGEVLLSPAAQLCDLFMLDLRGRTDRAHGICTQSTLLNSARRTLELLASSRLAKIIAATRSGVTVVVPPPAPLYPALLPATELRRRHPGRGDKWYLDEAALTIKKHR